MTLIYPVHDSARVGAETERAIASVVASFARFAFTLETAGYFYRPRRVLYLAPEPAAPFEALTRALATRFPDAPPYGGMFDEIVPHVQVADEEDPEILATIEADLARGLPIESAAREVEFVEHAPEGWRLRRSFRLTN
jgi:2'-5' RNA ligase